MPSNPMPAGRPTLRVLTEHLLTEDDCAAALALAFAGQPMRRGENAVREALNRALRDHLLRRRADAEPAAVARYRELLRQLRIFLPDEQRAELLAAIAAAARPADVPQPRLWNRHTTDTGASAVQLNAPHEFTLDAAARGLAVLLAGQPTRRFGYRSAQRGLQRVARGGFRGELGGAEQESITEQEAAAFQAATDRTVGVGRADVATFRALLSQWPPFAHPQQ
jgi:hypothetical protein